MSANDTPDTTQLLAPPAPAALRAELERLVLLDLLGPAGGAEEEIAGSSVRDRYLLGMLAPRQQQIAPEEQDDLNQSGEDAPDDGPIDHGVAQAPTMFPSSFGLTFTVDSRRCAVLRVTASWGRYLRTKSEYLESEKSGAPLTDMLSHTDTARLIDHLTMRFATTITTTEAQESPLGQRLCSI